MRYSEPVRFLYRGDASVAQRYVETARILLGRVVRRVKESGAVQGRQAFTMPSGVVITVVLAGLQAAVVIDTPPDGTVDELAGVIVRPTSIGYPTGLPGTAKELVLTKTGATWFPGFGFDAARIARRSLSYLSVAPDGFESFGEVDWQGINGLSCSFHGPTTRYFAPFRALHNFDTAVYSQGRVVFDGGEYVTRSGAPAQTGWLVVGAAMYRDDASRLYLRVVHADTSAMDAYTENYIRPVGFLPAANDCTHTLIDYLVDENTYTVTDEMIVSTFQASLIAVPFHFDPSGYRAIRMVLRWASTGVDPTRRIERLSDSVYAATDLANEFTTQSALYGPSNTLGYAYTDTTDETVAVDYNRDGEEVFLYFSAANEITGGGSGSTLADRPNNNTTWSFRFADGPAMPAFRHDFNGSYAELTYFTAIDIRNRHAAQSRRAVQGIAMSSAAVNADQKPNSLLMQSVLWTPDKLPQAELSLGTVNIPRASTITPEAAFDNTGLTRGVAMPAPLLIDYDCSLYAAAQFTTAYDATYEFGSTAQFYDPDKDLLSGRVKTLATRPILGQIAHVGSLSVISQVGYSELYHSNISKQSVRKATGFEGPTALYPMTVLPTYLPL